MASKIPHGKRGPEGAARLSCHPEDQAPLPPQRRKALRVRERGRLAAPRRPDPGPWRNAPPPQPQHWAEGPWPCWRDAGQQRARGGVDRLRVAHLLGTGGGWPRADLQGPARRGAAGRPRAREKQRAACLGEKRRQVDLVRLRPRPLKARRTAEGAGRAEGLPRLAPGPPEKSKGKRGTSRKTGGHRPDPRARGDLDVGALWAAAGGVAHLGDRERDGSAPGWWKSPARAARPSLGSKNEGLAPGEADDPVPPWPDSVTCGRGSSPPPPSPRPLREGSQWKRELESVFRELFSTNRKLKTHLNRYLESQSATATATAAADSSLSQELGFPGACGRRGERRAGDPLLELGLGPAEADPFPEVPSANLKELLHQLKARQYRRMVDPLYADEGGLAPRPEEEVPFKTRQYRRMVDPLFADEGGLASRPKEEEEETRLWYSLPPRHEPPRPDPLLPQLPPQALAGRAGPAAWPRQSPEQRWRPKLVEVLEVPQMSWEALSTPLGVRGEATETMKDAEREPPARALPTHLAHFTTGCSSRPLEEARGYEYGTAAPAPAAAAASRLAASSEGEEYDDRGHSQMIRGLQEQILEQNKSHQQFLEEARRRLQEFQTGC